MSGMEDLGPILQSRAGEYDCIFGRRQRQSFTGVGIELEVVIRIEHPRRHDNECDVGFLRAREI